MNNIQEPVRINRTVVMEQQHKSCQYEYAGHGTKITVKLGFMGSVEKKLAEAKIVSMFA